MAGGDEFAGRNAGKSPEIVDKMGLVVVAEGIGNIGKAGGGIGLDGLQRSRETGEAGKFLGCEAHRRPETPDQLPVAQSGLIG